MTKTIFIYKFQKFLGLLVFNKLYKNNNAKAMNKSIIWFYLLMYIFKFIIFIKYIEN